MKARIIEQPAKVYTELTAYSPALTELAVGTEVELGGIKKKDGKQWVAVTYPPNQHGYLVGDARVFVIKLATLLQKNVNVYTAPSEMATVKTIYKKNARFHLMEVINQDAKSWVRIRDAAGAEGYIDGQTKIKVIAEAARVTKALGKKNMLYGALWCIGGTIITVGTFSAASSGGGTYFITWGAIIFGALQFFQGLYQLLTAKD
jgi:hypothetical protein